MTIHDKLCAGLEALGAVKLPKKNKYTMYNLNNRVYFVGKAGALRVCLRANAAASIPCTDFFREKVLMAVANEAVKILEEAGL
jgi:hypothetical protein